MSHSEALVDLAAKAVLADLRVIEMEASTAAFGAPDSIQARFDASSRVIDDEKGLKVEYRVRNTTEVSDAEGQLLFSTTSTWGVSFRFTDRPVSTDELVRKEFQEAVVMMTVVPYVRELVNSTASRFGFPGVVFPLMKAGEIRRVDQSTEES